MHYSLQPLLQKANPFLKFPLRPSAASSDFWLLLSNFNLFFNHFSIHVSLNACPKLIYLIKNRWRVVWIKLHSIPNAQQSELKEQYFSISPNHYSNFQYHTNSKSLSHIAVFGLKVSSYFFFYAIAASLQPDPARINSINDYNTQTLTRSQVQRQKNCLACSEPCRFSSVPYYYTNQAVLCLTPFIPQRPILSNSYAYQSPPSPIPLL